MLAGEGDAGAFPERGGGASLASARRAGVAIPSFTPDDHPIALGGNEDPATLDEILQCCAKDVRSDFETINELSRRTLEDGPIGERPEDTALRQKQAEGRLHSWRVGSVHAPDNVRAALRVMVF